MFQKKKNKFQIYKWNKKRIPLLCMRKTEDEI